MKNRSNSVNALPVGRWLSRRISQFMFALGALGVGLLLLLSSVSSTAQSDPDVIFADRFAERPSDAALPTRRPVLVEAVAASTDRLSLSWLPAQHPDTRPENILYVVHRGETAGFTPSEATEFSTYLGQLSTEIGGLTAGDEFFVKVEAFAASGTSLGWSNELQAQLPSVPAETITDLSFLVLDETNASNVLVLPDRVEFRRLDLGMQLPAAGGLVISDSAGGFARIVDTIDIVGDDVTIHTDQDPASLNDVFQQADLRNGFVLADLPEDGATGDVSMRLSRHTTRSGEQYRRAEWQRSGLMLEHRAAQTIEVDLRPTRPTGERVTEPGETTRELFDNRIWMTQPAFVAVAPGSTIDVEIVAERVASEVDFEITSLELDGWSAPRGKSVPPHNWVREETGTTRQSGRLRIEPQRVHVDDRARPYVATFEARGRKTDCFWFCSTTATIEVPVYIGVEQIEQNLELFDIGDLSAVRFSGEVEINMSPEIRLDKELSGVRLQEAEFELAIDPATVRIMGTIDADIAAEVSGSEQLLEKRFVKIIPVGNVPVVISGTFTLDAELTANAAAQMGLTKELELDFDLRSGVSYERGRSPAFTALAPNLEPDTRLNLYGNAQGEADIDVRLVPSLEVRLYEVVGAEAKLEPYLNAGAALEGSFARESSGEQSTADYRFTDLYAGVGMDLGLRFDISAFDYTLVGYPSTDTSEFAMFELIRERRFIDLPGILLDQGPEVSLADYSHAIQVIATVDDRADFNFNKFNPDSAQWSLLPVSGVSLLPDPGGDPFRALLGTNNPQDVTIQFAGNGRLGSFARQFEKLSLGAGDWDSSSGPGPGPDPGNTFKDCPDCPAMVMIPAGGFVQGSPASEPESRDNERPQRTVNVPAFAMGQTAVTFDEWDACVADGGCSHNPGDQGWGRGNRPVISVSWNDAQQYVTWLSTKTGQDYRLPSESEWEYATRAGTTGRFNTGDCITTDQANFRGTSPATGCPTGIYRQQTLPVASFAPNAFGLYDTHGNTWEWVQDCWNSSYNNAPTNGSAWMTGDCSRAVLRGGSWGIGGRDVRSAYRVLRTRGGRDSSNGFRVARSVEL